MCTTQILKLPGTDKQIIILILISNSYVFLYISKSNKWPLLKLQFMQIIILLIII